MLIGLAEFGADVALSRALPANSKPPAVKLKNAGAPRWFFLRPRGAQGIGEAPALFSHAPRRGPKPADSLRARGGRRSRPGARRSQQARGRWDRISRLVGPLERRATARVRALAERRRREHALPARRREKERSRQTRSSEPGSPRSRGSPTARASTTRATPPRGRCRPAKRTTTAPFTCIASGTIPANDAYVFGKELKMTDSPGVDISPDGRWLVVSVHEGWAKNELWISRPQRYAQEQLSFRWSPASRPSSTRRFSTTSSTFAPTTAPPVTSSTP